ncbi:hypothetical protein [Streptomyces sp. NPDC059009]|uniref:hypothetical protein n=1 Tax=Streptomyces sp. NPDC059009 TaxID=3346694 RepID=UPI00369806EF
MQSRPRSRSRTAVLWAAVALSVAASAAPASAASAGSASGADHGEHVVVLRLHVLDRMNARMEAEVHRLRTRGDTDEARAMERRLHAGRDVARQLHLVLGR